jgi:hypothetical protein
VSILEHVNKSSKASLKRHASRQSEILKTKYAELRLLGLSASQAGVGSKLGAKKYNALLEELKAGSDKA